MPPRRPLVRFLCAFALAYGALIAPWPEWNSLYGGYFRAFCAGALSEEGATRVVRFRPAPPGARLDTQIVLADPRVRNGNGMVTARILGLDSRGVGWIPTALLVALVVATPIPWRRRGVALGLGFLAVHVYLVLTVGAYIWNESMPEAASAGSAAWLVKWAAEALEETLVTQLGTSFVVPVLIWALVSFRRTDLDRVLATVAARAAPPARAQWNR